MIRFIFLSIACIAVAFTVAPMFSGITKQHKKLTQQLAATNPTSDELTFDEIYALASSERQITDPAALNAIAPAAGTDEPIEEFSTGFSGTEDSALADDIKDF